MPLFEATPVFTAYSIVMVTISTEHNRCKKCHFLRRLLLLEFISVIMVTTCTEHTRSRKNKFLRRGDLTRKLLCSLLQHYFRYEVQKMPLFEVTPVTIGFSNPNNYGTEHIGSR